MDLSPDTLAYLNNRAAVYGGNADNMLRITPPILQNDDEVQAFWRGHELSHIQSQAMAPHLADDWSNILPEDPTANRARGSNPMSLGEQLITQVDNWIDATFIALDPDLDDSPLL